MPTNFWITGTARSGTTAIARILDTADKTTITVEHNPQLHLECRCLYDGVLDNAKEVFYLSKKPMMDLMNKRGLNYGDKNVNYVPFIPFIDEKIVFVVRDGRDVVRSLMNWDTHFGTIYNESKGKDIVLGDYCRPRPKPSNPYYTRWPSFNMFDMCCWYWSEWNNLAFDLLEKKNPNQYKIVNMNTLNVEGCKALFDWLGLKGFNEKKVREILYRKINSLQERFNESNTFPLYGNWNAQDVLRYWEICKDTIQRLGNILQDRYTDTIMLEAKQYDNKRYIDQL